MGNREVDLDKEVYTTFDVANICNANITSIKNWIEKGQLQAHRTPGGHYRIKRSVLEDFLNRHGMPNPFAERERKHIFAFHSDEGLEQRLRERFGEVHEYDSSDEPVYALLKIGQWRPDALVIEEGVGDFDLVDFCESFERVLDLRPVDLIAVHDRGESYSQELRKAGAEFPVDADDDEAIFESVRRALL